MVIKFIASVTAVLVAMICVLLLIQPNDPLFYSFVSASLWAAAGKSLLMLAVVILAFKNSFNYAVAPVVCAVVGAALISFGLVGLLLPSVDYALFNYVKVLDFLIAMEVGVVLSIVSLSHERGNQKLPRISRPRQLNLGLPYQIRSYFAAKQA